MAKINIRKTATGEFGLPPVGCVGLGFDLDDQPIIIHEDGTEEPITGATQTLLLDRVAYVNQDYEADIPAKRVFTTKAAADAYIAALTGDDAPSATSHWAIIFGGGSINEDCIAYQYVDLVLQPGTLLKSLTSASPFADMMDVFDVRVFSGVIAALYVAEGMGIAFQKSYINNVTPVEGDGDGYLHFEDCWIMGADFSNTVQSISGWNNMRLFATEADISGLSGMLLVNSILVSGESFSVLDLPKIMKGGMISADNSYVIDDALCSLYGVDVGGVVSIGENATLEIYNGCNLENPPVLEDVTSKFKDYRNTLTDDSNAASITNVGKMRYRVDGNVSYCEMVMQTAASTWEWVVIKQNSW